MSEDTSIDTRLAVNSQERAVQAIEKIMDSFMSTASIDTAYQKPIKHGEALIIPTAESFTFLGFGLGSGGPDTSSQDSGDEGGGGGGGGGSTHTRPVAVIISTPEGVRVDPVFDLTKVAVTAMATGVMVFGAIARMASMMSKVKGFQDEIMR